jgi:hypothetical protein
VHDTSSKNAKLSSATSFPWRHTNTSKNHGYIYIYIYIAVADDSRRQQFRAEDSAPAPDEEGHKGRKAQTFSDYTYPAVSSRPRGRCVQSLVQIGSEMWICIRYKQTNKQKQTNKRSALYIRYVPCAPGQHDSSINIRTVYTATTQNWLHGNCSNKMILAHFIVNRTFLMFYRFYNIEISTTTAWELA